MVEFGTGKTSLMISKAKKLSQKFDQKVVFVIFQNKSSPLSIMFRTEIFKSIENPSEIHPKSIENCKVENIEENGIFSFFRICVVTNIKRFNQQSIF